MFALTRSPFLTQLAAAMRRAIHILADRRWLMGAYVFFFAFVAPLLCWGSMGDPTHPHVGAHFVFAEPVLAHADANNLPLHPTGQDLHHAHDPCLHPSGIHDVDPSAGDETKSAAARAVPATLLAQLLIFVTWGYGSWTTDLIPFIIRHTPGPWLATAALPVPTPPPRLLSNSMPPIFGICHLYLG